MPGSWRLFNYTLRASKHVERKMLAEAFARLDHLAPLGEWRYVGLGSLWFADFSLFHRRLGFRLMHSIEKEELPELQQRFRDNIPYETELHFGSTTTQLPTIPWNNPAVVWLDYDSAIETYVFDDIAHVVSSCTPPTVLLLTVNVNSGKDVGRLDRFRNLLGRDNVPDWVESDVDLGVGTDGMARAVREFITNAIEDVLTDRNAPDPDEDRVRFQQLFNFRYADGSQMLSVGGLLHRVADERRVAECNFNDLPFVARGDEPYIITVPVLTVRETLLLDAKLPASLDPADFPGVDQGAIDAYSRLYRYLPVFVDADL